MSRVLESVLPMKRKGDVMTEEDMKEDKGKKTRMSKLDSKWCKGKQLGRTSDFVEYMDYSGPTPVKERIDFDIEIFPAEKKTYLRAVASDNGKNEDVLEIQENFEDLLNVEALGIDLKDILEFKKNKPVGVYETVSMKVQTALGMLASLTKSEVESAKNSEGQGT